jgi:glucose/arabinose dehydrogenase
MLRIVALLVLAALAAPPAAALAAAPAQQQPLQQQAPAPSQNQAGEQTTTPTPTPAPTTQTQADSSSFGKRDLLLVAAGIVVLIGGIWFVIARDAKRATAGHVRPADSALGEGRGGSATRSARRSRRLSADERKRRKRGRAR